MRDEISRSLLKCLKKHDPKWIKSMEAQILLNLASRSFRMPGKSIWHLDPDRALKLYAAYTVHCMKHSRSSPRRLFRNAYQLGSRLRRITGFTEDKDLQQLVYYLYRNIGITVKGTLPGEICIPSCYFSEVYTSGHCRLMSYVDAGIIAGLFQGGRLRFTERLTEGCDQCRACLLKRRYLSGTYVL